jgi:hypothetical protein
VTHGTSYALSAATGSRIGRQVLNHWRSSTGPLEHFLLCNAAERTSVGKIVIHVSQATPAVTFVEESALASAAISPVTQHETHPSKL